MKRRRRRRFQTAEASATIDVSAKIKNSAVFGSRGGFRAHGEALPDGERHMTTNTKKVSRGAGERRPPRKNVAPRPLSWWRTIRAEHFDTTIAKLLREQIAMVAIIGEPAWDAAVAGDTAAAIGMALRLTPDAASPVIRDLVMTALLACAAEDNAAACLALSHSLRSLPGAGRMEARLATSWLVRNFTKAARSKIEGGRRR